MNWKLRFLPFLYRSCPMGNAHLRSDHTCYCCEGNQKNWTYVWTGKQWVPVEFALDKSSGKSSSVSYSGQLTTLDLIWSGVKTGIIIATIFGLMAYFGFRAIMNETQKYAPASRIYVNEEQ